MTELALSPRELDHPESLRAHIADSSELVFEVVAASPGEPPLFALGAAHQVLCELQSKCSIVLLLPHHDSVSSTSSLLAGPRERLLLRHAKTVIGKGRRDLTVEASGVVASGRTGIGGHRLFVESNDHLSLDESADPMFSKLIESVRTALSGAIRDLGVRLPAIDDDPIVPATSIFVKEALDNVRLHALRSVTDDGLIDGSACVLVRRLRFTEAVESAESEQHQLWREGIENLLERRVAGDIDLLEVTVADAGDGIPATMKERLGVYGGPHVFEIKAIDDALRPKGTRPSTRPSITPRSKKGFGFSQMTSALASLRGQMQIRTGRTQLAWSSIDRSGKGVPPQAATKSLHAWETKELPQTTGTSVSFVMALNATNPVQLDTLFDQVPG